MIVTAPEYGPNLSESRFKSAIEFAVELEAVLGVEQIHVWYDSNQDFTIIEFVLDGQVFVVRSYRVHAICRNHSQQSGITFQLTHQVADFFRRRLYHHIDWPN